MILKIPKINIEMTSFVAESVDIYIILVMIFFFLSVLSLPIVEHKQISFAATPTV